MLGCLQRPSGVEIVQLLSKTVPFSQQRLDTSSINSSSSFSLSNILPGLFMHNAYQQAVLRVCAVGRLTLKDHMS